ncbi:MAG: Crp/Fnr family transcriptional regulator [Chloroflexota bacterium]
MNKSKFIRDIPAFVELTDEQSNLLATRLGIQTFERSDLIFDQGSMGSTLYIIVDGQVRIFTVNETGQELAVTIFRKGDFFGELALLDGQPRSASAEAMQGTTTLTLHRSGFLDLIGTCPPVAVAVLEALASRLRHTNNYVENLTSQPAPQRVVQQLVTLAANAHNHHQTSSIDLRITQDDLASLSGTTRETVNRVLSTLRDQGLIRIARARISVLSLEQLRQTLMQS